MFYLGYEDLSVLYMEGVVFMIFKYVVKMFISWELINF